MPAKKTVGYHVDAFLARCGFGSCVQASVDARQTGQRTQDVEDANPLHYWEQRQARLYSDLRPVLSTCRHSPRAHLRVHESSQCVKRVSRNLGMQRCPFYGCLYPTTLLESALARPRLPTLTSKRHSRTQLVERCSLKDILFELKQQALGRGTQPSQIYIATALQSLAINVSCMHMQIVLYICSESGRLSGSEGGSGVCPGGEV